MNLPLNKGRVNSRNRNVATARVWKRKQRGDQFYCTITMTGEKPVVRSCRHRIRSSAEEFARLLLVKLMNRSKPAAQIVRETQLELPPP